MSTTSVIAEQRQADAPPEVDVLVVGAGLSGIGAAVHLQAQAPGTSYALVEMRQRIGGTWDLFRYPGVRSDSDMVTLGYRFKPWRGQRAIVDGAEILDYIRTTAEEYGVEDHITYDAQVVRAQWSSEAARWTVTLHHPVAGRTSTRTCGFLYLCSGYYRYDEGYTPTWDGLADFGGRLVHPQHWPDDLDLDGKRVVVVGSGATAVTLVPALARTAAHVTMLQRSPSYVLPLPSGDPLADLLRRRLPARYADAAVRWKNIRTSQLLYGLSQRYPARVRSLLRAIAVKQLPTGFDVDTHFSPVYNPWDQRMCLVPDGDFFRSLRDGHAEVVTDTIERFTATGLRLHSGAELSADVVVAATGLHLLPLAGIPITVDGEEVEVGTRVAYKGMMLDGVPNLAFAIGYTNASWTLKVDMVSDHLARLQAHMRRHGLAVATPRLPDRPMRTTPFIEMTSGYFERSRDALPRQGDRAPWRLESHVVRDAKLFTGPVTDPDLALSYAPAAARVSA